MHVVRNLPLELFFLHLNGFIEHSRDTLSKDLSKPDSLDDLNKHIMAFLDETKSKGCESKLGNGTVVEDLIGDILKVNRLSNVGL
jgi:hypothetical protein